ncbi:MAG TPA: hypothetical protein VIK28_02500 [Sedimentisphaerales bacterium]
MTTTTAHKRLDDIETHLTPKEWAIRLADEVRKYPDALAHMKALVKLPLDELPVRRPFFAFEKQADEQHPGDKPEDIRARHRLTDALWGEFHTLKLLIRQVNQAMQQKVERIGLEAAFQLFLLHVLIQEDAFAHTATQAAALLTTRKQRETKNERQAVLKQLAAFTEAGIGETPLKEWGHELTALLNDFFAHLAAVQLVQGEHFDGHPILYPELEAKLTEATRTIESAVVTANEHLKSQPEHHQAETNGGTGENNLAIALESIKASASGQRADAIAEKWMNDASHEAVESDEERWERCREEFGAREPTTGNG